MPVLSCRWGPALAAAAMFGLIGHAAADGLAPDLFAPNAGESVTVEPFIGYLRGTAGEYVYNPANPKQKVSQLDWNFNALAAGARVAFRPADWLTVRGRFWATVSSEGDMTDYDWLAGYFGRNSWTHRSVSPDTDLGRAWQGDVSLAYSYYTDEDLALTAIAGYRHYDVKYNARGGSFVYSTSTFRDTIGTLPDVIGIAYRQVFQTPYLGLGAVYQTENWAMNMEAIGSPFVMSRARDYHALRDTLFKDDFDLSGMVGVSAGVEYRVSPVFSIAGRVEYQKYLQAKGSTNMFEGATGTTTTYPKPSAGADADTLLVTIGAKARL